MRIFKSLPLSILLVTFFHINIYAQFGQMPPFSISIAPVTGANIQGVHSFAFAQSGDKWLIVGGRTNGLHGLNSNDGFPAEFKNDDIIVIDTTTWQQYTASLTQLPWNIADPLRSTNMQYVSNGNYLYMAGGFGYDSTLSTYVTFPTLSAIHIDDMINAVINAQPIASTIRQVVDTNFRVCGGDMGMIGSTYYLCFGHDFEGRYADPPVPIFTQQYINRIKKFGLTDNGTSITLSPFTEESDTTNFHRRDLTMGPIVLPGGSFGLKAYGGVFQKTRNLPYREPITITATGTTVNMGYQQMMSHYTCANIPVFDSVTENMYSTFLGGISLYDYNPATNTAVLDTLVPFVSDITTMTTHPGGMVEETILPVQLSGLLGSNAKFVLNGNIAHYENEVIKIRALPNTKVLAGYMYGGIRAQQGNFGSSAANDTIFRIYITPNTSIGINEISAVQNAVLYPNPAAQNTTLLFSLKNTEQVRIALLDVTGKELLQIADEEFQKGSQRKTIDTSKLAAGIYFCRIATKNGEKMIKLLVGN